VKILIAPDSYKESLSAVEVANSIEEGILNYLPEASCIKVPLADGGEGTVDAILQSTGGEKVPVTVKDPLMRDIPSFWGRLSDSKTAVIEMAAASGIELLSNDERNPMITSSFGTGQLIKTALDHGCKKILIGIGGSATNDGGAGMARALGAKLISSQGKEVMKVGMHLSEIQKIDLSNFDQRINNSEVIVISDVENPLCGENGASFTYGPQKGAHPDMVEELDRYLLHFGKILESHFHREFINVPGAGAAGGMGAGLMAFCDAVVKPGFNTISEIIGLEKSIQEVDFVITGEGRLDYQTKFGKAPFGLAQLAQKFNKPVIAIAGSLGDGYQELYDYGFQSIFSISEQPQTLELSIINAEKLLINTAERIIRLISIDK
jgi:glycerate kinase